jgi:hypothetical protein
MVEDLLGLLPLFPCFIDGNSTSTIPYMYTLRQKQALEFGCADGQGPASRRGSHVYEINTWLWNFGRPQPRVGGLSVAKTERIRRQSRSEIDSETSRRAWETEKASKVAAEVQTNIYMLGIYILHTFIEYKTIFAGSCDVPSFGSERHMSLLKIESES